MANEPISGGDKLEILTLGSLFASVLSQITATLLRYQCAGKTCPTARLVDGIEIS